MSIGHSTHPLEGFVGLLRQHRVEVVVDVRTSPFSRFNPQFNRDNLLLGLREAGIRYLFLGEELGGKPDGDEFYDPRRPCSIRPVGRDQKRFFDWPV